MTSLYPWDAHLYMKGNRGRGVNEGRKLGGGTRRKGGRENFGWVYKNKKRTHTQMHAYILLCFCEFVHRLAGASGGQNNV